MNSETHLLLKKKVVDNYGLIQRLINKRFATEDLADEAFLFVIERLERDDWRRIREFKGNAAFTTYLTKVISNLLLDFADHKYGKYRPPQWIKRMGALWLEIHKRLCRERMPKDDVEHTLLIGSRDDLKVDTVREIIDVILAKIPDCGAFEKGKLIVTDPQILENVQNDKVPSAGDLNESEHQVHFQEALFPFLKGTSPNPDRTSEDKKSIKTKLAAFQKQLNLNSEERLFLKLIYQDGFMINTAGRRLSIPDQKVHRFHKQLLERIELSLKNSDLRHYIQELLETT